MKLRITATTDHQYLGQVIESTDNPIVLGDGIEFYPDRLVELPGGVRFVSSNYIIDAEGEIK